MNWRRMSATFMQWRRGARAPSARRIKLFIVSRRRAGTPASGAQSPGKLARSVGNVVAARAGGAQHLERDRHTEAALYDEPDLPGLVARVDRRLSETPRPQRHGIGQLV